MLGTMNLYGNGVPVDYDAALTWMRKALATKDTRVKTSAEMVREA
jgi:TPR repeat protein